MRLTMLLSLATLVLATGIADARRKKAPKDGLPSVAEVSEQVRGIFTDVLGNSDAVVRRAAFNGLLSLDKADQAAAMTHGLTDPDPEIHLHALGLALKGRDKKARVAADKAVNKLLESGEAGDRALGMKLLSTHLKAKARVAKLVSAAKLGTPDARKDARAALVAVGGKVAWKVISAGFARPVSEVEHKEAVAAFETFKHPVALKWAMGKIHDDTMGSLARAYLVQLEDRRAGAKIKRTLKRAYDKSADFPVRLRLASVLAGRGMVKHVSRTLRGGIKFKAPWARVMAWKGLRSDRDRVTLGKLKIRILTNQREEEADAAYAWLTAWALSNAEPKVIAILQQAARSDRRPLRLRAYKALTDIKHRASAPLFEQGMAEGQIEIRLAVAKGLAAIARPGDEKRMARFLRKEPNADVKLALIQGLANIGTPEIIDSLQFVVTAREKPLKLAAAKAVAATGRPKAALLLGLLKRDADIELRFFAWVQLLKLQPRKTEAGFRAVLSWLTPAQVEVLGATAHVSDDLLEMVAKHGKAPLRVAAVKALATRGPRAATRLLGLVEGAPDGATAAAALHALAALRKADSVPTYRKALKSKFGEVRAEAFLAIGLYGPRALLETCLGGLTDADPLSRAQAARASLALAGRR